LTEAVFFLLVVEVDILFLTDFETNALISLFVLLLVTTLSAFTLLTIVMVLENGQSTTSFSLLLALHRVSNEGLAALVIGFEVLITIQTLHQFLVLFLGTTTFMGLLVE
jgi:hypothetical protein